MKTALYSMAGSKIKDVDLAKEVFEAKINEALVQQAVKTELANKRAGTASTKTRSEVSGGGIKPWRQKGTGRARAGSIRSPLFRGGGITFGPKPRDYSMKFPTKMRKASLKSILTYKAKHNELIVLEKIDFKDIKTKNAVELLKKIKVDKKSTIMLEKSDEKVEKSFRNIPKTRVISISEISAYDILDNDFLILTEAAASKLKEVLS